MLLETIPSKGGIVVRIAICDDDSQVQANLFDILMRCEDQLVLDMKVVGYVSGEKLCDAIEWGERYDLIYLTVETGPPGGVETAQRLRKTDQDSLLVFLSGQKADGHALLGVQPYGLLKKPLDREAFETLFFQAHRKLYGSRQIFCYESNREKYLVPYKDILYFSSDRRQVKIHLKDTETVSFYGKLSEIIKNNTNPYFFTPHKSYFLNYHFVKKISARKIEMVNDEVIRIPEAKRKTIRSTYERLKANHTIVL